MAMLEQIQSQEMRQVQRQVLRMEQAELLDMPELDGVASLGIAAILLSTLLFSRRFSFPSRGLSKLSLGLILGGTIGNLADRIRLGYVTDFIDLGIWPAFNIADSAIVVGVILFAYSLRSLAKTARH